MDLVPRDSDRFPKKVIVQRWSIRKDAEECYVSKYWIALDRIKNIYQTCF